MTASITNITFGNYVAYEGLSEGQWVMSVSIQDSTGATNTYNITRDVIGNLQYDCGAALEQSPYPTPMERMMQTNETEMESLFQNPPLRGEGP